MDFQDIAYAVEPNRAVITLNRPDRLNALNYPMIDELKRAIAMADAQSEVCSIVIRGAGRAFCAGDSLKGMGPSAYTGDRLNELRHASYYSLVNALHACGKPIITVAHGYALGAGLELFMAGDIKLATADAKLGIPFVNIGLVGLNHQLVRYVGLTKAAEMILTAEPISGAEGKQVGLVTAVIDDETAIDAAVDHWSDKFVSLSLDSIRHMKATLYQAFDLTHEQWFDQWMLHSMSYMNNLQEGERIAAWLSGRSEPRDSEADGSKPVPPE